MLKWKRHRFASILDGVEDLTDIIAGMSGKNRVIKYITGPQTSLLYFRVYRDAEQIVDFRCNYITSAMPLLPMDLPLAEGQLCKAGFYNNTTGTVSAIDIIIGYEETG